MPRILPRILPMHLADVDFPAGHPHAGESGPMTESGPVLLAGQAVYSAAEWEGSDDPRRSGLPSADDPNADAEFVRRVRDLDPVRSTSPTTRRPGTGGSDSTPPSKGPTMQGP